MKAIGVGRSKTSLIKKAKEVAQREEYHGYEVWCVFDFDYKMDESNQKQDFNQAVIMAKAAKLHVAWSNDCIELWFVLHYKEIRQRFIRFQYYQMLNTLWNITDYEQEGKREVFSKSIYERLLNDPDADEARAIARAIHLCEEFAGLPHADRNPCTTVHELVIKLKSNG